MPVFSISLLCLSEIPLTLLPLRPRRLLRGFFHRSESLSLMMSASAFALASFSYLSSSSCCFTSVFLTSRDVLATSRALSFSIPCQSFASTPAACADTVSLHAAPEDHPMHDLFLQRQRNASIDVEAADGMIQVRTTMGNLMGDRFIPSVFSLTYRGRIARTRGARWQLRTLTWFPGVPSDIDISTVTFADDFREVHPIRANTQSTLYLEARRIVKMATDEAEHLTREIAKEG